MQNLSHTYYTIWYLRWRYYEVNSSPSRHRVCFSHTWSLYTYIFFKDLFIYFGERGKEGERQGEKHGSVASLTAPTGDLAHNPGLCPDWESNWWPFGLQAGTQSTEPCQSQLKFTSILLCREGCLMLIFTMKPIKRNGRFINSLVIGLLEWITIWLRKL